MENAKIDVNAIVRTSGNVTNNQSWNMEALRAEFVGDGSMRILLKLSRNWKPICLRFVLLLGSVSMLSLTSFALAADATADKLDIVLGLILALIFVELPSIPIITLVHKYFYSMFAFLVAVALDSAIIEVTGFGSEGEGETRWEVLMFFVGLFILVHILLFLSSVVTFNSEQRKIQMGSDEIFALLENGMTKINVYGKESFSDETVLEGTSEPIKDEGEKSFFGPADWWKVSTCEWVFSCFIIIMHFFIGSGQYRTMRYLDCKDASSNLEIVAFLFFACIALLICMLIYCTVGISRRLLKLLIFALYLIICVEFYMEVDFFAVLTHCTNIDTEFQYKYTWWLLLVNIIVFGIAIVFHICILVFSNLLVKHQKIWAFFCTITVLHFMAMSIGVYQWVILHPSSIAESCFAKYDKIWPINMIVVIIVISLDLYFMMTWMLTRMFVDYMQQRRCFTFILRSWIIMPLFEMAVSLHGFIFWVYAISVGMADDDGCTSFTFVDEILLLVFHTIWMVFIGMFFILLRNKMSSRRSIVLRGS